MIKETVFDGGYVEFHPIGIGPNVYIFGNSEKDEISVGTLKSSFVGNWTHLKTFPKTDEGYVEAKKFVKYLLEQH